MCIKPQRKNAGGRKNEQHPYHPHPKPLSVQSAVGGAHQESVSTATNEHAKIDHQPSQQSLSAKNEPSSIIIMMIIKIIILILIIIQEICKASTLCFKTPSNTD